MPLVGTPTRVQVGLLLTGASALKYTRPSSEPVYTAPPPPTPMAEMVQLRAPLGDTPLHPVVRSGLIAFHLTSPTDAALALSVRYSRQVPRKSWLTLFLLRRNGGENSG